jgi:hypothetical protein
MVARLREELLVLCQGVCGEIGAVKLKIHFTAWRKAARSVMMPLIMTIEM